jgi:hypothetical protein
MRFIATGISPIGLSSVIESTTLGGSATLHATPDESLVDRPADKPALDAGRPAGTVCWKVWEAAPDLVVGVHRTDTIDYDTVLRGEIVLVLDDAEVVLRSGDCVMLPGVMHGWRSGPDGATISVVQFGIDSVPGGSTRSSE